MPTRIYLPSSGAAAVSPAYSTSWDDISIASRLKCVTSKIGSAMTTVNFSDSDSEDKNILFRQYVSDPIQAQTILAQTIKIQMRGLEYNSLGNMLLAFTVRIFSNDGTILRGTVVALSRDDIELSDSALTNRSHSVTSSQVIAQYGDRIVIEVGTGGDPFSVIHHDSSLSIGDDSGTDLPENDTETNAYNPWVEFANTVAFVNYYITQTDSISLAEALKFLAGKSFAEGISLAEVLAMLIQPNYAESFAIADACDALIVQIMTHTETINLGDFIDLLSGRVLSEDVSMADAILFLAQAVRSETISLADTIQLFTQVAHTEGITVTDVIAKLIMKLHTESLTVSDIMSSYIFVPNIPLARYGTRLLVDMILDSGTRYFSSEDIYIEE